MQEQTQDPPYFLFYHMNPSHNQNPFRRNPILARGLHFQCIPGYISIDECLHTFFRSSSTTTGYTQSPERNQASWGIHSHWAGLQSETSKECILPHCLPSIYLLHPLSVQHNPTKGLAKTCHTHEIPRISWCLDVMP